MRTIDAFHHLTQHHGRILAELATMADALSRPAAEARNELARSRWTLARLLREYQIFKHMEIFDPSIRGGDPVRTAAALRMKARCIRAGERFREHVATWGAHDMIAEWDRYRAAKRAMIANLRNQIAEEERDVAALLATVTDLRRSTAA